jgi:hypothetical protein
LAIILIWQCCIYDVTVFSYVYNVDIWCWVGVGYVECVTGYVVLIQAYAATSAFGACWNPMPLFKVRMRKYPEYDISISLIF